MISPVTSFQMNVSSHQLPATGPGFGSEEVDLLETGSWELETGRPEVAP